MPTTLGRTGVWTAQVWSDIDKAVADQVDQVRVVQKVIKPTNSSNGPYVPADQFDVNTMKISDGKAKPFLDISIDFTVTANQFDNEATLHTAQSLAKLASKALALAEDKLLLQGRDAVLPPFVKVLNKASAEDGLVGAAAGSEVKVASLPHVAGSSATYGANLVASVGEAVTQLSNRNQPGPYALIVESSVYTDAFLPLPGTQLTAAGALTSSILKGGFYGTAAMPAHAGLLISLGGDPTTLYVGQTPITAYVQDTADGSVFRVSERVQFVARDKTAFVNLKFEAAAKVKSASGS